MGGDIGEIQLGSERELHKYINHYAVVTKASSTIILVPRCTFLFYFLGTGSVGGGGGGCAARLSLFVLCSMSNPTSGIGHYRGMKVVFRVGNQCADRKEQ